VGPREGAGPEFPLALGAVLRTARRQRGLRLKDVPRCSGLRFAPTTVAGYEHGERAISLERFCALARLYGVSPQELLGRALDAADTRDRGVEGVGLPLP